MFLTTSCYFLVFLSLSEPLASYMTVLVSVPGLYWYLVPITSASTGTTFDGLKVVQRNRISV